jgi:adenylate kinase
MRVILLGAPGSGKGTVGELIERVYGLPRIATGDLLRRSVQEKTPLGRKAAEYIGRGGLVPDDLVVALVRERLDAGDTGGGYVLDGFPRTIAQAQSLEAMDRRPAEVVIDIEADETTIIGRLEARRLCPRCAAVYNLRSRPPRRADLCDEDDETLIRRDDDHPEIVRKRLRVYHQQTERLVAYYAEKGTLHRVAGGGTVDETFAQVRQVLDRALSGAGKEQTAR